MQQRSSTQPLTALIDHENDDRGGDSDWLKQHMSLGSGL